MPLGQATPLAEVFLAEVKKLKGVKRADIGGSLRRGKETIGDIDILCETDDGESVVKAFTKLKPVKSILAAGKTKGSVTVPIGRDRDIQIDLRAVPAESFGAALQYFTGSKEHNVRVREVAVKKGWKLNEWGLFDGEQQLAGENEQDIYEALNLPYVIPELREDRGELDTEIKDHVPIELADIKGDVHMHTVASDGKATIEEMAEAAKARGYEYIAITDHSRSSVIANGLSIERLEEHIEAVRAADKKIKGIRIFTGCEADILSDGTLDYPDEVLAVCDIVVASIHVAQSGGKRSPTDRTLAAIENPYVTIIGHPTGRLINRRKPMDIDMARIMARAAETGTALEINAAWKRLDLNDRHARQAIDAGVMLTIDTDAHHPDGLDFMRYGVTTARRARVTAENVANTKSLNQFDEWRMQKRSTMA
jgi:DNA polymerase (family 10)